MTTVIVIAAIGLVILTGSISIARYRPRELPPMSDREAIDRLRPHSGAVESSPQKPPIEGEA